jgi:hypothetical protein
MTLELYSGYGPLSSSGDLPDPNAKGYPCSYDFLVHYACRYYNSSPESIQKASIYTRSD